MCINLSNFKEISNIDILINLCLGTSLHEGFLRINLPVWGYDATCSKPRPECEQRGFPGGVTHLEFPNWILTHMRALGNLRPGFYTEFRAGSIYQSVLAWGAILEENEDLL